MKSPGCPKNPENTLRTKNDRKTDPKETPGSVLPRSRARQQARPASADVESGGWRAGVEGVAGYARSGMRATTPERQPPGTQADNTQAARSTQAGCTQARRQHAAHAQHASRPHAGRLHAGSTLHLRRLRERVEHAQRALQLQSAWGAMQVNVGKTIASGLLHRQIRTGSGSRHAEAWGVFPLRNPRSQAQFPGSGLTRPGLTRSPDPLRRNALRQSQRRVVIPRSRPRDTGSELPWVVPGIPSAPGNFPWEF
jgi:hypothetical protein